VPQHDAGFTVTTSYETVSNKMSFRSTPRIFLLAIPINFNGDNVWGSLPAFALENAAELAFRPGAGVSLAQVEQVDARVVGQSHYLLRLLLVQLAAESDPRACNAKALVITSLDANTQGVRLKRALRLLIVGTDHKLNTLLTINQRNSEVL